MRTWNGTWRVLATRYLHSIGAHNTVFVCQKPRKIFFFFESSFFGFYFLFLFSLLLMTHFFCQNVFVRRRKQNRNEAHNWRWYFLFTENHNAFRNWLRFGCQCHRKIWNENFHISRNARLPFFCLGIIISPSKFRNCKVHRKKKRPKISREKSFHRLSWSERERELEKKRNVCVCVAAATVIVRCCHFRERNTPAYPISFCFCVSPLSIEFISTRSRSHTKNIVTLNLTMAAAKKMANFVITNFTSFLFALLFCHILCSHFK